MEKINSINNSLKSNLQFQNFDKKTLDDFGRIKSKKIKSQSEFDLLLSSQQESVKVLNQARSIRKPSSQEYGLMLDRLAD